MRTPVLPAFPVTTLLAVLALFPAGRLARAQTRSGSPDGGPSARAVRSADGRLLVVAEQARQPVVLDGRLDDAVWQRAAPVEHFVQAEPADGQPASERTLVRVAWDDTTLYIAADCRDSRAGEGLVNDIREDFQSTDQDTFEVIIDTFADRQNGFMFLTNRAGARSDRQVANEGRETNASWDAVWSVRTAETAEGWTVEMAIPFRSLRFERGLAEVWGINFSRRVRHRNEVDFWSPVPRAYALSRVSLAGDLQGLGDVSPGRNIQLKPYALARSVRDVGTGRSFDAGSAVGLDAKVGLTPSLTLDLTAHPDFAQVEADELTVNLTQFSTFYQEKRDFFIENSGTFYVGDTARNTRVTTTPTPDEDLLLFHSRRIGLSADGTPIQTLGGARLTGRAGRTQLGLLTMQVDGTSSLPSTNYTVLRARRSLGEGSDVGAIMMSRATGDSQDFNRVYGADMTLRFLGQVDWNTYAVKTSSPGVTAGQYAFRTSVNREGNYFHGKGGFMTLGDGFRDDIGTTGGRACGSISSTPASARAPYRGRSTASANGTRMRSGTSTRISTTSSRAASCTTAARSSSTTARSSRCRSTRPWSGSTRRCRSRPTPARSSRGATRGTNTRSGTSRTRAGWCPDRSGPSAAACGAAHRRRCRRR
ncbi:MAG: DUF5916 domain-containing protein [Vicinamibacterales bacterium]